MYWRAALGCFPVLLISFILGSVDLWSGSLWLLILYILIKNPSRWESMAVTPGTAAFSPFWCLKMDFQRWMNVVRIQKEQYFVNIIKLAIIKFKSSFIYVWICLQSSKSRFPTRNPISFLLDFFLQMMLLFSFFSSLFNAEVKGVWFILGSPH